MISFIDSISEWKGFRSCDHMEMEMADNVAPLI